MSMIMAESFDAPMTDSGDTDVSMYPGGMTADSWLSAEASMGDVAYSADTATFDYMQEGVEVEMLDDLDDDAAITEYEMADDGDGYYDHELEDVEVLDVSRGASIPPVGPADVSVDANAGNSEMMHVPPYDGGAPVASGSHYSVEPSRDDSALYSETHSTAHPEHPVEADALAETSAPLEGDVHHAVSASSPSAPDVSAVVEDNGAPAELPAFPTLNHAEDASTSTDPAASESHSVSEDRLLDPVLAGPSDVDHTSPVVPVDSADLHPGEESAHELAADDPHEISDGVYIDPPPPVLLSLPPSAEHAEYCLFNQPQSSTSPSTPGGSKSEPAAEPLRLLLHDRPTLYYEPLSSVFDALRHEECILNLPGSSDAELVLDAYELRLAICEDNVYAHEVTLHELDVIHGGSDLHGPLRLKLKFVAPRFVTRYHLLREQISRLNLTADGDELLSGVAASDPVYEQEYDVSHEAEVPHHHAEDGEARASVDEHYDGPIEGTEDGTHEELREGVDASEAEALAPNAGLTDNHVASERHEAVPEQLDGEDGTAALEGPSREATTAPPDVFEAERADLEHEHEQEDVGEGEGTLDANDVHEHADAGEGGDYVEHDEFPDDEDDFGDDLPEEIGGQTENEAYTHTGAVEDAPQDSAYAEEEGVDAHEDALEASSGDAGQGDPDAASLAQDDEGPLADGLDTNGHTDTFAHLDSADDYDELHLQDVGTGQHDDESTAAHPVTNEHSQNYEDDPLTNEESTTLSSEEDGLADDWDDDDDVLDVDAVPAPEVNQADALSRKSSSATLASKSSKRTYDEVELDDFDDDPSQLEAASTPETKRPRVQ